MSDFSPSPSLILEDNKKHPSMETSPELTNDSEEVILKIIDRGLTDLTDANEIDYIVNDIKGLWLLAKMTSGRHDETRLTDLQPKF